MSHDHVTDADPRMHTALAELEGLIRARYPSATFTTFHGEDPEGMYLRATVDLEDPDEVMDVVIDRLYDLQVEHELPVYVIPVRTAERSAALRRAQQVQRRAGILPSLAQD